MVLAAIGAGRLGMALREGFFMFWATLWALVLGFGLSGAVQAFVSRQEMERLLGDHRPRTVLRASGLGAVSSSCSYAATAMAKSLFAKGADFVSAMVFMFASTNLVLELGIVLVVLMGWQFAAAEFAGGAVMIVLLVVAGGWLLRGGLVEQARRRIRAGAGPAVGGPATGVPGAGGPADAHGGHGVHDADGAAAGQGDGELQRRPWAQRLRSPAGWADAASYTMADLTMLRRELVIGYLVAGGLAVLVPAGAWDAVFWHGHGAWTSLENALVGPLIAVVSFVCSIGNVPMAAALWHGGISFGGVVSFIFADLITFPLLVIYRKYYGTRLALRLLVVFWAVMSAGGLVVEGLFAAARLIPASRPAQVVASGFRWDYTTVLDLVALAVFAVLVWLARNRERLGGGGGRGLASDPVCGMQVQTASAPASAELAGRTWYFCSDHCKARFTAEPGRYGAAAGRVTPSGR